MVKQAAQLKGDSAEQLARRVSELQQHIAAMEAERELRIRKRRRNLLLIGGGLSICLHVLLMLYLGLIELRRPGGATHEPVSIEFAVLDEQELTRLEQLQFEELQPLEPQVGEMTDPIPSELDVEAPSASLQLDASTSMPTLGGSGGGGGGGGGGTLGGGAGGTSFFGVSSSGNRFAYIVDVSASMAEGNRILYAMRELARSIQTLPDYASFFIALYNTAVYMPPTQDGWIVARPTSVNNVIRWLNDVIANGGTQPGPAFQRVFALAVRPDVIFFMTDGEIPQDTADLVASLNLHGGRVVINTIAFGNTQSQEQLKQIAQESGGVYRFVPSSEN